MKFKVFSTRVLTSQLKLSLRPGTGKADYGTDISDTEYRISIALDVATDDESTNPRK